MEAEESGRAAVVFTQASCTLHFAKKGAKKWAEQPISSQCDARIGTFLLEIVFD